MISRSAHIRRQLTRCSRRRTTTFLSHSILQTTQYRFLKTLQTKINVDAIRVKIASRGDMFQSQKFLPKLPIIENDEILKIVFTAGSSENFSKYELLGDSIFSTVLLEVLLSIEPELSKANVAILKSHLVSNKLMGEWSILYDLGSYVFPDIEGQGQTERTIKWYADLFEAYVAGVYLDRKGSGMLHLKTWIAGLINDRISLFLALKPPKNNVNDVPKPIDCKLDSKQNLEQVKTLNINGNALEAIKCYNMVLSKIKDVVREVSKKKDSTNTRKLSKYLINTTLSPLLVAPEYKLMSTWKDKKGKVFYKVVLCLFGEEISEGVSWKGLNEAERKSAKAALTTENKKLIKCVKNKLETELVKNNAALLKDADGETETRKLPTKEVKQEKKEKYIEKHTFSDIFRIIERLEKQKNKALSYKPPSSGVIKSAKQVLINTFLPYGPVMFTKKFVTKAQDVILDDHETFRAILYIDDVEFCEGISKTQIEAERAAAANALTIHREKLVSYVVSRLDKAIKEKGETLVVTA